MASKSSPALGCSDSCNALDSFAFNSDGMKNTFQTTIKNLARGAYDAHTVEANNMLKEFGLISPIPPKWTETEQGIFKTLKFEP